MKFEFTKKWCMRMAHLEKDAAIGVGQYGLDPALTEELGSESIRVIEQPNIAFGRLINLMRRKNRLSVEKLANDTDIDIAELVEIEDDTRYKPEPRTVYQLANYFKIPRNKLMQIAGLTASNDAQLIEEAVRFAARSDPLVDLTKEERAALDAFVSFLSEQK